MCNLNQDNMQMQNKRTGQQTGHSKIYDASFLNFGLVKFIVEIDTKIKLHYSYINLCL